MMDAAENETRGEVPRVPPPDKMADMGEILRWLATVSAQAGMPVYIEIMGEVAQVTVTLPSMVALTAWMAIVGIAECVSEKDHLGVWNTAETSQREKWDVRLNCHIPTTRG